MPSEAASGPSKATEHTPEYNPCTEMVQGLREPYNRSHAAVYALSHYRLLTLLAKLDRMSA